MCIRGMDAVAAYDGRDMNLEGGEHTTISGRTLRVRSVMRETAFE
jgi:hypothetical protein